MRTLASFIKEKVQESPVEFFSIISVIVFMFAMYSIKEDYDYKKSRGMLPWQQEKSLTNSIK